MSRWGQNRLHAATVLLDGGRESRMILNNGQKVHRGMGQHDFEQGCDCPQRCDRFWSSVARN